MDDPERVAVADREALTRLVGQVHDATAHLDMRVNALQLYREARDVAEARIPGPLGVAVACALAFAADERSRSPIRGSLGASKSALALALAVLETLPE